MSYAKPIVGGTGAVGVGTASGILPVTGVAVGALVALAVVLIVTGFALWRFAAIGPTRRDYRSR